MIAEDTINETIRKLTKKYGDKHRHRIKIGVAQTAQRWQEEDGGVGDFETFCLSHFISDAKQLDQVFNRFQRNLEALYGNFHRVYRTFNWPLHVDDGKMLSVDSLFSNFDVFAHIEEDFFQTRLAFVILLNYPIIPLEEKSKLDRQWSRRRWAEVRLVDNFLKRIPGEVHQKRTGAYTEVEEYIYNYNLFMYNILNEDGEHLFPEGLKLISHWGLRDELKGQYANPEGFPQQQMIHKIMERIIYQEIPEAVINNADVAWKPFSNDVIIDSRSAARQTKPENPRRYAQLWKTFKAEQLIDPFSPDAPSLIDRRFKEDREILEEEVESLLNAILSAPVLKEIAGLIKQRLNRELQPWDIWYTGFTPGVEYSEDHLNEMVHRKYPSVKALQGKLPELLRQLGFSAKKAKYLQKYIQVDPARGAGHALGAQMRFDRAHLRTRVPEEGMDYKSFNTAMHELGHSVEQVFSMNDIDFYTLEGVPNTAFTEAFAFVFQSKDFELLGLTNQDSQQEDMRALHSLWQTLEIGGVSLLDMRIWRWMYDHPEANPEALKEAVIDLATNIWNDCFAPVLGIKYQPLLAIYSHLIYCGMYVPDYAIGHIIAFQIEDYLRNRNLAEEMERMCKLGRIAPQVWMQEAVGAPISVQPMIVAAEAAVKRFKGRK